MTQALSFLTMVAISILQIACATSYQPKSLTGGYEDYQLQNNLFEVSFEGNGYTSESRARNFALYRAAEVSLENGYRYFEVLSSSRGNRNSVIRGRTTASVRPDYAGGYTVQANQSPDIVVRRPRYTIMIRLVEEETSNAMSARQVLKSIKVD